MCKLNQFLINLKIIVICKARNIDILSQLRHEMPDLSESISKIIIFDKKLKH
jgi:hypothetical protein